MKKLLFLFLLVFATSGYAQSIDEIVKRFDNHLISDTEYKERMKVVSGMTAKQLYSVGYQYYQNGSKDRMKAEAWLTSAVKKGSSEAKQLLQKIYEEEKNDNKGFVIDREKFVEDLPLGRMYLTGTPDENGNMVMYLKIYSKSNGFFRFGQSKRGISFYIPGENGEFCGNSMPMKENQCKTVRIVVSKDIVTESIWGCGYVNVRGPIGSRVIYLK